MKMTKTLFACGDSFTDPKYTSVINGRQITKTWPEFLADKLDGKWDVRNLARSGVGNDWIVTTFFKYIAENGNPDLVCILWTKSSRFNLATHEDGQGVSVDPYKNTFIKGYWGDGWIKDFSNSYCKNYYPAEYFIKSIDGYLTSIYIIQQYCKSNNIPYAFGQGIDVLSHGWEESALVCSMLIDHPQEHTIDDSRFFGWPVYEQMGGWHISKQINDNCDKYGFCEGDLHPNELGHDLISDHFLKILK